MADPIVIQLQARGVQELQAIFRSLEQSITALDRNIATSANRSSNARLTAAQKEAKEREKVAVKVAQDEDRQAKVALSAVERAEREKVRAAERTARVMASIRERSATMAGQYAAREADREIREADRVRAAKERFARNMAGNITSSVGGALRGIVGVGRGLASSALQVGGGFSIADSVQRELKLTGQAATIASSSQADADGTKWKTKEILASARNTARALSMDPEEVLKGIDRYKSLTGNLGEAIRLAPEMGKLATAMGADTGDLMANAGNAYNAGLRGDDIMRMARVQTQQGIVGAVELPEMAKQGARIASAATLFGGDRAESMATMGALAQVARQHGPATSAAEATMGALRFATDVAKNSKALEKHGITVSDGQGTLLGAKDIIRQMLDKTGGDVTKLGALGLGDRGVKPLQGFASIYRDAMGGTRQKGESDADFAKREAKGKAAVLAEFDKFTGSVSDKDIDASAKERLAEADKKVTEAMNRLRDAVGQELLPEFLKLVELLREHTPELGRLLRGVVSFAEWFAKNPIKGIGAVVLAAVAKDLAGAAIGEAVKQAIVKLIAGAAPGGAGGASGVGGKGAIVTKALGTGAATAAVIVASELGNEQGKDKALDIGARLRAYQAGNRTTGMSPEEAKREVSDAEKRLASSGGALEQAGNLATAPFSDASAKAYAQFKSDQALVDSAELRKQIAAAVVGGVSDGVANRAHEDPPPPLASVTLPLSARP